MSVRDRLTDAIRACNGSAVEAARLLGVTRQRVSQILREDPSLWPEGVERNPGRRTECRVKDLSVMIALLATYGKVSEAAERIGCDPSTVRRRIREDSAVWPATVPVEMRWRSSTVTDTQVTEAIREHRSLHAAARALGITSPALHGRLHKRPGLWPEGVRRLRRGERP